MLSDTRDTVSSALRGESPGAALASVLRSGALLGADLVAYAIASLIAFSWGLAVGSGPFTRAWWQLHHLGTAWHGWATLLVLACLLAYLGGRGHYTARIPFWIEAKTVLSGTAFAFAADGLISVVLYRAEFGNVGMLRWLLFVPLALALRQAARLLFGARGGWRVRTLIIGEPQTAAGVDAALRSEPALGYDLIGNLAPAAAPAPEDVPGWMRLLAARKVQLVVVLLGGGDAGEMRAIAAMLARARVPLAVVPAMEGLPVRGFSQNYFLSHDVLMLTSSNDLDRSFARLVKVALDQVGAVMLLFLLAPLFLVLASLVRGDGGPVLFRHRRIGAGGQGFDCLKFRTMVPDAEAVLQELLARDPAAAAEWRETQKLRNDPRITRVGRFLRRSSLDELPQLINVLRGEMSLVGPRPIVAAEVERYGTDIDDYYRTKPGLTGLWQVSGRSDTGYARRVQLDRWYARNWTLWHDIAILLKTIPAVFGRRGAL
jgi:Undecaprenyl-phosphate galactose phosphotransferase WbaP